jgi:hypothetical protein
LSMSEGERASIISADHPLPFAFAFAHTRICPDVRKILEKSGADYSTLCPEEMVEVHDMDYTVPLLAR